MLIWGLKRHPCDGIFNGLHSAPLLSSLLHFYFFFFSVFFSLPQIGIQLMVKLLNVWKLKIKPICVKANSTTCEITISFCGHMLKHDTCLQPKNETKNTQQKTLAKRSTQNPTAKCKAHVWRNSTLWVRNIPSLVSSQAQCKQFEHQIHDWE